MSYGKEVIIDLHGCNPVKFNREDIDAFFKKACKVLDASPEDCHFWDDVGTPEEEKQTDPRLVGTSAIQFILTSNITIHTLDLLGKVFINAFSCAEFDENRVIALAIDWFEGQAVKTTTIERI